MPEITDIQPLEDDPNYRVVYVDNNPEVTLPTSALDQLGLVLSQEWTEEVATQVALFNQFDEAKSMGLNLISRKAWGVKELAARLVKRGIDKYVATMITEQLEGDGWLDDYKYASARIREWTRIEPASRLWLRMKLRERYVGSDHAEQAINEELGDTSEQDLATALAVLRLAKVSNCDENTARRRVISALSRRGFPTDVGAEAFRRAQSENA